MPFKSEKQRRYLWANEPEIARDWSKKYGSRVKKNTGGLSHQFENYAHNDGDNISVPRSFQARPHSEQVNLAYITPREEGILQALNPGTPHRGPMEIPNYDAFDARGNYATSQQHDAPTPGDVRAGVGSTTGGGAGDTRIKTIKQNIRDVRSGIRPEGYNVGQFRPSSTLGSGLAGGWKKFLNRMRTVNGQVMPQSYFSEEERQKRRNARSINTILNRDAPITDLTHKRLSQLGYTGEMPGVGSTAAIRRDPDYLKDMDTGYARTHLQSLANKMGANTEASNIIDPSADPNLISMFGGIGELVPDWLKNVAKTTWGNRDIGSMMQGTQKGLSDWFWGKGMRNLQDLPESAKVWMAHGPKPDDYAKLAAKGFSDIRPASKITNLVSPRAWEQFLSGQNPLASRGVYTAVAETEADALKAAGRFAKPWWSRGTGAAGDLSKVFSAQVPRSNFPISSGATRVSQMEVPSSFANKWFGLGDKGAQLGSTPAKGMIKGTAGRLLPGVGAALGIKGAYDYAQSGDYGKMLASAVSALPGPIGWAGLGAEYGLKGLDRAMTNYRQNPYAPENTLVMNQGGLATLWPR